MSEANSGEEKSALEQAVDEAKGNADVTVKSYDVTETIEVVIPKNSGEKLLEGAIETWESSDMEKHPRRHRDHPERSLKEFIAEKAAKEKFLDRHEVKRSSTEAYARTRGRRRTYVDDGEMQYVGEVWEVMVRV